ncbi:MAG: hypothetical protein ACR652_19135 [Methylocystis sp.]|uniref:hypothetical protein n=1 Tax=Methylocystis sp. TaxID=1911079 RepID=UPI003DA3E8BB
MVERMAEEKRSARQIVEAGRAYAADRAAAPQAVLVWLAACSPEGRAWAAHWRATKGKTRQPMQREAGAS